MGSTEQTIAKQAIRAGRPLPDKIANAPELKLGLSLYMQAFFDLDSERSHSSGPSPIPWTSIKQYSEAWDFDEEQTEDLLYLVREMDKFNLKRIAEKRQ